MNDLARMMVCLCAASVTSNLGNGLYNRTGREGLSASPFSHSSSVLEIAADDGGITVFVHRYELSTDAAHQSHRPGVSRLLPARPYGSRIRHEDEKNGSAILM